jgi:hypothetical protein
MAEPEDNLRFAMEDVASAHFLYADNTLALASIAVSLKRIADALDPTGGDKRTSMNVPDILFQLLQEAASR